MFPAGTDVTVRREGTRLFAPGVGDDTRSLAVLLAFIRALDAAAIRTRADILFVGDVGEEGLGDLRGMRHLFGEGRYKDRIGAFVTVDSPDMDGIAMGGIGSQALPRDLPRPGRAQLRRVRPGQPDVRDGAGGAGAVAHRGAGRPADHVQRQRGRRRHLGERDPRRGVAGGRSALARTPAELTRLERRFLQDRHDAVQAENHARSVREGEVIAELKLVGDRPAGATDPAGDLVRYATDAIAAHGFLPRHVFSSTDANIAMSLGIPAVKIGSGGSGGRGHSLGGVDRCREKRQRARHGGGADDNSGDGGVGDAGGATAPAASTVPSAA